MKKIILLALAVIMVFGLLAACSANGYVDANTPDGYGNVSTTRDGRVNGTNNYQAPGSNRVDTNRVDTNRRTDGIGVEGHIGLGRMS